MSALFDVQRSLYSYAHVRESSYSQVPESQLVECVNSMFALELECVNSMFALSLVSTLVTNILLASVQTNDTMCCTALLRAKRTDDTGGCDFCAPSADTHREQVCLENPACRG